MIDTRKDTRREAGEEGKRFLSHHPTRFHTDRVIKKNAVSVFFIVRINVMKFSGVVVPGKNFCFNVKMLTKMMIIIMKRDKYETIVTYQKS